MKKAFTLLEVIVVIVVIGILSAAILPRLERDTIQEATEQVLSHIRYTQHLAMIDDVYDNTQNNWFKKRWQIQFTKCADTNIYRVYSDTDMAGSCDLGEEAIDPYTNLGLYFSNGTCDQVANRDDERVNLTNSYGIQDITFSGGCSGVKSIGFDHIGRPYKTVNGASSTTSTHNLLYDDCLITLIGVDSKAVITIEKETGYARVTSWN